MGALMDSKTRDYFNSKVKRFFALAPIAYLSDVTRFGLKWLTNFAKIIDDAAKVFHIYVLEESGCTKNNEWEQTKAYECKKSGFLCDVNDQWPDEEIKTSPYDSKQGIANLQTHDPSGASAKCFDHYAQIINSGNPIFCPYNYGWFQNLLRYGSLSPPEWEWKYLTAPLSLLAGQDDALGTPVNTDHIVEHLVHPFTRDNIANY